MLHAKPSIPRPMTKTRHIFAAALFAFMLILTPFVAQAGEAEKQELQTIFNGFIDGIESMTIGYDARIEKEGDLLIEDGGSYYAITLPHIKIFNENGGSADIGMIAVNAIKGEEPGSWKMTLAIPTPITFYNKDEKPLSAIDIGAQNFAGVWNNNIAYFTQLKAAYKDIVITSHNNPGAFKIPMTTLFSDLKPGENGRWTGPFNMKMSGLSFEGYKDMTFGIDEITMSSSVRDYSFQIANDYIEKIDAMNETYEYDENTSMSSDHVLALYGLISNFFMTSMDGTDFNIAIENLQATRMNDDGIKETLKLDSGAYGVSLSGLLGGSADLGINFSFNGFDIEPPPAKTREEFEALMPDQVRFDINLARLPLKELIDLVEGSVKMGLENPAMGNMAGIQAAMSLPQLLTQARSALELRDITVNNENYNFQQTGEFVSELSAQLGFKGKSRTVIGGMDNVIGHLKDASANSELSETQLKRINDAIMTLSILQMVGQQGQDSNGNPARIYDFELKEDGQMLLNGTDIQTIMQSRQ